MILLVLRNQIEKRLTECFESMITLKSQLRQKGKKKYTPDELANKNDRLERIKDNLEVLKDLFND